MKARATVLVLCLAASLALVSASVATAGTLGKTTIGTTNYPISVQGRLTLQGLDAPATCAVVQENQAYLGNSRGEIIQIDLETLRRVRSIVGFDLDSSTQVLCASIGQTGYFLTSDGARFADIVEVDLETLTVVGHESLAVGPGPVATFSEAGGALYLGVQTTPPKIIKFDPSSPSDVTTLTLEDTEIGPSSAVVADGFGYFGVRVVDSGRIVKVDLSSFTRVDALDLEQRDLPFGAALVADGAAYFAASSSQYLRVVKIDLAEFMRVGAIEIDTGLDGYASAESGVVVNGFALFGVVEGSVLVPSPPAGSVMRINLDDFTLAEMPSLGRGRLPSGIAFESGGAVYVGTSQYSRYRTTLAELVQYDAASVQQTAILNLDPGEDTLRCAFRVGDQAYFGGATTPGHIVQVDLSTLSRVRALDLQRDEQVLGTAVEADGFGYFGTYDGKVVKVDLADLTRVAALQLEPGEVGFTSALAADGFAYFTPAGAQGKVVKIDLGTFTRVGAVSLGAPIVSAVRVGSNAYFGLGSGSVVRMDLQTFSATGSVRLSGERLLNGVVASGSFGYFVGSRQRQLELIKVDLRRLTRVGSITFRSSDSNFSGAIATDGRSVLLHMLGGGIVRVDLRSMKQIGALKLADIHIGSAVVADEAAAYFAASPSPYSMFGEGVLLKASLGSPQGAIHATRAVLRGTIQPQGVSFYAHEAGSIVRLAIYDSAKTLLWESRPVRVRRPNSTLTVRISRGAPGQLGHLRPGTYYLAWQIDSNHATPSYKPGTAGAGWSLPQAFGSFPEQITGEQTNGETWTEFVTF